jgi:chemotaxis protein CheX
MADTDLPSEFLNALTEATVTAFREVAATEVLLQVTTVAALPIGIGERYAFIDLTFPFGIGRLTLQTSAPNATVLAERVLAGQNLHIDDSLSNDCLGEIANVIAGQGKVLLVGSPWHYVFGTPYFADHHHISIYFSNAQQVALTFQCDLGLITLCVLIVNERRA